MIFYFLYYNTVAAFAALKLCKIENSFICDVISNMNRNKKLYDNYSYNSRDVYVLNNKNENATTFNQALLYSTRKKNLKTFVIGWWQISRRYPYDDLSWLYDIEFELLKRKNRYYHRCRTTKVRFKSTFKICRNKS